VAETRDWQHLREQSIRLLEKQTGEGLAHWNNRVQREGPADEQSLRAWLSDHGVTGYAQSLLVMERFGYPEFLRATADDLIAAQYADRPVLLPIFDSIIAAATGLGAVVIQARKTYVSLLTSRRTFARIQATTRTRVDVGLRLDGQNPAGRLQPSRIHENMPLQISLTSVDEVDDEFCAWLQAAYTQNS
jgi:hypothetical protein